MKCEILRQAGVWRLCGRRLRGRHLRGRHLRGRRLLGQRLRGLCFAAGVFAPSRLSAFAPSRPASSRPASLRPLRPASLRPLRPASSRPASSLPASSQPASSTATTSKRLREDNYILFMFVFCYFLILSLFTRVTSSSTHPQGLDNTCSALDTPCCLALATPAAAADRCHSLCPLPPAAPFLDNTKHGPGGITLP